MLESAAALHHSETNKHNPNHLKSRKHMPLQSIRLPRNDRQRGLVDMPLVTGCDACIPMATSKLTTRPRSRMASYVSVLASLPSPPVPVVIVRLSAISWFEHLWVCHHGKQKRWRYPGIGISSCLAGAEHVEEHGYLRCVGSRRHW